MSELSIPLIELSFPPNTSFEQALAEEAWTMLLDYGTASNEIMGSKIITTLATERVDIPGVADNDTVGLRLRSMLVMTTELPNDLPTKSSDQLVKDELLIVIPTDQYAAIVLEYANFKNSKKNSQKDDALDWQQYVLIVSGGANDGEVCILNAVNGQELNGADLMRSETLLSQIHKKLRSRQFAAEGSRVDLLPKYQWILGGKGVAAFKGTDHIRAKPCGGDTCTHPHGACSRLSYSIN